MINEKIDAVSNKTEWRAYIVERPIEVRLNKCFKSTKIAKLFDGEKVNVVKVEKKWVYIEFFDYKTGLPNYGWVPKKYLKAVEAR